MRGKTGKWAYEPRKELARHAGGKYLDEQIYGEYTRCPTGFWLKTNGVSPSEPERDALGVRRENARKVMAAAREYFKDVAEAPTAGRPEEMAHATLRLLATGNRVVASPSFLRGDCFARCDFAMPANGADTLKDAEDERMVDIVKVCIGSCATSRDIDRLAFQCYCASAQSDAVLSRAYILRIDTDYVRNGDLDVYGLFVLEDVTDNIGAMLPKVPARIEEIKETLVCQVEPPLRIHRACLDRENPCRYRRLCMEKAGIAKPSVLDIVRLRREKKLSLIEQGIVTFPQVVESGIKMSEKMLEQVLWETEGRPPRIDREAIRGFLGGLKYPLCFLDFETFMLPIPRWDGTQPYEQLPSQYSLHIRRKPGGRLEHREFLAPEGEDPRRAVAEGLVRDIPEGACIVAYNDSFERGVIRKLAERFGDLEDRLMAMHGSFLDLMLPFAKRHYYERELCGKFSIKAVLPALCPEDPSLDYGSLDGVHNGADAMDAYAALEGMPRDMRGRVRKSLLAYCRLDTLAMVKVLDELEKLAAA
jgi:hypothetical protein